MIGSLRFRSSTSSSLSSSPSTATVRSSKSNNSSGGADHDAANNTNNSTNLSSVSGGDSLHENSQKTRSKSMSVPRTPRTPVTVLERPGLVNNAFFSFFFLGRKMLTFIPPFWRLDSTLSRTFEGACCKAWRLTVTRSGVLC